MSDFGMSANIHIIKSQPKTTAIQDNKKSERTDSTSKHNEGLAGALKAEETIKKEDIVKTEERYKAFYGASKKMLGIEDEEEIDEESLKAYQVAKKAKKDQKNESSVNLAFAEPEKYDPRKSFKAKVSELLGEDFNEDEEPQEKELSEDEKESDKKILFELSKEAYQNIYKYIVETIGAFDFDNIDDLKLFLRYGIPEEAILKLLFLHQLANSDESFPTLIDISILIYKCQSLDINITDSEIHQKIEKDYGTSEKLKYTVAGFIYIPIAEAMNLIKDEIHNKFLAEFDNLSNEFGLEEINNITDEFPNSVMLVFKSLLNSRHKEISNLMREYLKTQSNQLKFENLKDELLEFEIKISKIIYTYFYLATKDIEIFNNNFPYKKIKTLLNNLGVRVKEKTIKEFLKQKASIHTLDIKNFKQKELTETSQSLEMFETKTKSAVLTIKKTTPQKQQELLKNIKANSFEISEQIYWLKQNFMSNMFESTDTLVDIFKKEKIQVEQSYNFDDFNKQEINSTPSKLKIELLYNTVDFSSYKGDVSKLFKELIQYYKITFNWNRLNIFEVLEDIVKRDLIELLKNISYLPNTVFFPNLIETLALSVINGNISIGNINDIEKTFQDLKKIYAERVQALLLPFLFYIYNFNRKLLPIKQKSWEILNKNGKIMEASIIMDDIQKSNVIMKKSKELIIQERFNIPEFEENINLLLLLTDENSIFYPIYNVYKETITNSDFDIEEILLSAFGIDNKKISKRLLQELVTFKTKERGLKIMSSLGKWTKKNTEYGFADYLNNILQSEIQNVSIDSENFGEDIREIIFSIMTVAQRRMWSISDIVIDLFVSLMELFQVKNANDLKILSYTFAKEIVAGSKKINYKLDKALEGLGIGLIELLSYMSKAYEYSFLTKQSNYKLICEYVYTGIWDISIELYSSLVITEKNLEIFTNSMRKYSDKINLSKIEDEADFFEQSQRKFISLI